MKGLIHFPKLDDIGGIADLAVALFSISAVLYVMATAFTGSGVA
ncbi:MAG TPA: hypothetical protein VG942_03565 [Hyphomonadaceae bacterium]|nr:hypothetical protein [Hyphomonadaceae bacterium]